jgi:hypothetical protein
LSQPVGENDRLIRKSSTWGLALGGIIYFALLFNFGLDPWRTAVQQRFASNFFDLQAQAFLDGHISVPTNSLGIEGFVVDDHTYMYFPPFPALLRIPFMLVTHEFDGRLSLLSMAIAWLVFATMTSKLFWLIRASGRRDAIISASEAVTSAIFLAAATGGTVLVFDAALPWVYHEVYLWAVALAIGALFWLIRVSLRPEPTAIWWLAAFSLGTILTRTTGGWAICAVVMATGFWILSGRLHPQQRRSGLGVLAAGLVPLLIAATYNFIKFRHPYLFPLQDQVWTQVNEHRRKALARNGGTITGPQFFLTSLVNYFRPDGIRFVDYFPYITLPAEPAKPYGGAFLDQSYRTGSITAFMPLLCFLSVWGCVSTMRRRASHGIRTLRLPLLGALAISGGVMGYGYVTYRYTSEFVPLLVVGSAIGVCHISRLIGESRPWIRRGVNISLALLASFSVLANVLTGVALTQQTWRGDRLVNYVSLQQHISSVTGDRLSDTVSHSAILPSNGRTDELRIIGDCQGLYLNIGDQYEPWLVVEQRDRIVKIKVSSTGIRDGRVYLFTVYGRKTRYIDLETSADQRMRFVVVDPDIRFPGPWLNLLPGQEVDLTLHARPEISQIELSSVPGGAVGYVPLVEWDKDWISRVAVIDQTFATPRIQANAGMAITGGWGPPLGLCRRLAESAGISWVSPS